MSEALDETIKGIAVKHGVSLGKDDPILILQTMNERLIEQNKKAQQELLAQFKEEIEQVASKWQDDAKEKAEKILNSSLSSSTDAVARILHELTNQNVNTIKQVISDSLIKSDDLLQQARTTSRLTLMLSSCLLTVSTVLMAFMYIFK
jgi:cell division septum initiation protein DivIVA